MEIDKNLISILALLYNSLTEDNVKAIDFLLRMSLDRWSGLESPTAITVLIKMKELGIWKVDLVCKECYLSDLVYLLEEIRRHDLSAEVKGFGQ